MVGLHHQFNGLEFEPNPRDSEGQGCLVCCSPWGHKESDMTELLKNKTKVKAQSQEWVSLGFPMQVAG